MDLLERIVAAARAEDQALDRLSFHAILPQLESYGDDTRRDVLCYCLRVFSNHLQVESDDDSLVAISVPKVVRACGRSILRKHSSQVSCSQPRVDLMTDKQFSSWA